MGEGQESELKLEISRWVIIVVLMTTTASAQSPQGKFQCRRFPQDAESSAVRPVAYLWIRPNGDYELLDLTTTRGKTSGHYVYDSKEEQIDWTTGVWSKLIGHYVPHIAGTSLIRVNTKKDPDGQIDGTMPCVRIPE